MATRKRYGLLLASILVSSIIVIATLFAGIAKAVEAQSIVPWTGHGSDVEGFPCADGGHWVLAPAFGVDTSDGQVPALRFEYPDHAEEFPMTQNGEGSWAVDVTAPLPDYGTPPNYSLDLIEVVIPGTGDERNSLQLSHCLEGETPSPTPTPTPTPSPSESPTPTVPPSTSTAPPTSGTSTPPGSTGTHTPSKPTPSARRTAFTGSEAQKLGALALLLTVLGAVALRIASRKRAA